MQILLVAFSDSIHLVRWTTHLQQNNINLELIPSIAFKPIHPDLCNIAVYQIGIDHIVNADNNLFVKSSLPFFNGIESVIGKKAFRHIATKYLNNYLFRKSLSSILNKQNPKIIHTMETQNAGYLVSDSYGDVKGRSKWIHSTWGVDLHYYKEFPEHRHRIVKLLSQVDLLVCEGERDIIYAKEFGYKGKFEIFPSVGGGLDFVFFDTFPHNVPPSKRKKIILKGYDGDERAAGYALNAMRKMNRLLDGFEVIVYSCSDRLVPTINAIRAGNEFKIKVQKEMSYADLVNLTCEARISITNNLSDGVPNTMLEAMALGAFPIQSNTAITEGWLIDGQTGFLTEPTNVDHIVKVLIEALQNDALVDKAAFINKALVREKLNKERIKDRILEMYKSL